MFRKPLGCPLFSPFNLEQVGFTRKYFSIQYAYKRYKLKYDNKIIYLHNNIYIANIRFRYNTTDGLANAEGD